MTKKLGRVRLEVLIGDSIVECTRYARSSWNVQNIAASSWPHLLASACGVRAGPHQVSSTARQHRERVSDGRLLRGDRSGFLPTSAANHRVVAAANVDAQGA